MVFMNMGGPSTTDEVGDFLSRLFVSSSYPIVSRSHAHRTNMDCSTRPMQISYPSGDYRTTSDHSYRSGGRPKSRSNMLLLVEDHRFGNGRNTRRKRCARF
jgi:hypothetical protein